MRSCLPVLFILAVFVAALAYLARADWSAPSTVDSAVTGFLAGIIVAGLFWLAVRRRQSAGGKE